MKNNIFQKLKEHLVEDKNNFATVLNADNHISINEVISYIDYSMSPSILKVSLNSNILITEGDIITTLNIIHDLVNYNGEFILFVNYDNISTNYYLVNLANTIYKELNIDVSISLDTSRNYNKYLNEHVNIIGSTDFINTASKDFASYNMIML